MSKSLAGLKTSTSSTSPPIKKGKPTESSLPQAERKADPYKFLDCPLFMHQKHSHACVGLRAKGVCKVNCKDFFEWAMKNEDTVKKIIKKHTPAIQSYRTAHGSFGEDLLQAVMPKGENICEYCGKAFKAKGWLESHQKKRHRRLIDRRSD